MRGNTRGGGIIYSKRDIVRGLEGCKLGEVSQVGGSSEYVLELTADGSWSYGGRVMTLEEVVNAMWRDRAKWNWAMHEGLCRSYIRA